MLKINLVEKKVWEVMEGVICVARFNDIHTALAYLEWVQDKVDKANAGKDVIHG